MNGFQLLQDFSLKILEISNIAQKLENYQDSHALRRYKLVQISRKQALSLYQNIQKKFYRIHSKGSSNIWFENQLRLFVWVLICYMELKKKHIREFIPQDWSFFSKIFYIKSSVLFEYQAKIVLDYSLCLRKWSNQEDSLLIKIVTGNQKFKWNEIAKQLFSCSSCQFIRTSKQCRERWLNHLDPSKSKLSWTLPQCKLLLASVLEKGKKWASLVQFLHNKRSQHSIKNKYNSMIIKQKKVSQQVSENKNCEILIQRIDGILSGLPISENDQQIFGDSVKLLKQLQGINVNINIQEQNVMQKSTNSFDKAGETRSLAQNEHWLNFNDLLNIENSQGSVCPKNQNNFVCKLRNRKNIKLGSEQSRNLKQQFIENIPEQIEIFSEEIESSLMYLNEVKLVFRESQLER